MFYIVQTIVITFMLYSFTKNHYIAPLHSCLMAKVCNHTGIKRCGLEKDHHDKRLFLDDCDMFEYNCDYKKAYSEVNDELCATEESPSVNISSQATTDDKHTTSNATTSQTTTTQTETDPVTITMPTESVTTVSGITTTKCTCMDLQTIPVSNTESSQTIPMTVSTTVPTKNCTCNSLSLKTNESIKTSQHESATIIISTTPMTPTSGTTTAKCTCTDLPIPVSKTESTITSTQIKHECTCTQAYSELPSMRTAIDNSTKKTSNKIETTAVANGSESPNVTESTIGSTNAYANVSRIPTATECTRGNKNSTAVVTSEKQNTNSVIKSSASISNSTETVITGETKCTCMDTEIPTNLSYLETNTTTIPTYSETGQSTTSTNTEIVSTSAQKNSCTCNSVSLETNETITTQTELNSEIIIIPTKPMTPVSKITSTKCTCMDLQTNAVTTTESITTSIQTLHHCTCTNSPSEFSSITTIDDKTTHTQLTNDDYLEQTLTEVDTTPKHSCDKYPKHCKRPLTWETTARGETRDFFQILRERFGNRVKILKDTTHWPLRIRKPMENNNDAFYIGTHNDI